MSKILSVEYNPANKNNTFSSGDCITGQVKVELKKHCRIGSLSVKMKGKAEVRWYEPEDDILIKHYSKEKFFSIKKFVIEKNKGEGIKVVASIHNNSSRDVKPKYCLYMECSYTAKTKTKSETKDILKEVGDAVPPSAEQTVTRIITIPPDMAVSILNCIILKVEYRLRVYLDIKYAIDPKINFPIVILPVLQGPDEEQLLAHPPYGSDAFADSFTPGGNSFAQSPTAAHPFAPPPP